ncbi:hypothetical protein DY000_02014619 [Brassica cretica]|uniref:Uncharacterized protein n=1 Tax=Brassica cretica TaxID=69181 RepID=A0ABQ7D7H3_BRACR|nr:hypothetical protein DY000_02014619 [Brassica cretica]
MAKIALRGEVPGKAVSWELGTTLRKGRRPDSTLNGMNSLEGKMSMALVGLFEIRIHMIRVDSLDSDYGNLLVGIYHENVSYQPWVGKLCAKHWLRAIKKSIASTWWRATELGCYYSRKAVCDLIMGLIGFVGAWFHGRLGMCEDSSVRVMWGGWLIDLGSDGNC